MTIVSKTYSITGMVTRIGSGHRKPHLYMVEWRESLPLSVQQVADRVGVSRETIWRWETEQHRLNPDKIHAYAEALGIEDQQLYYPPSRPSADALIQDADAETHATVIDVVKRLMKKDGTNG